MGRKRSIIVDTGGRILTLAAHPADVPDGDGAQIVAARGFKRLAELRLLYGDSAYAGSYAQKLEEQYGWKVIIVRRPDQHGGRPWIKVGEAPPPPVKGFQVLPHRWVVERTFAWLLRYRRLAKDYEATLASSEAFLWLAAAHLLAKRLARGV